MELRQIRHFVEVYKFRNFTHAAQASFISAQGISMSIQRLEEEINCKLFNRTAQGLIPTPYAEYFYPRAVQMLAIADECEMYFKKGVGREGFLPVMMSLGTIEEFAGIPIAKFKEENPNVYLDVQETFDTICDSSVENGVAELALTIGPVDEKKLDAVPLLTSRHALIVNKDHPLAERQSISASELKGVPVAVLRDLTKTFRVFGEACRKAGFEPTVSIFADNILLVYYMAEINQAVGISVLPLARRLNRSNLRAIPFEDPELAWTVYLIKLKNARLSPPAREFERMLLTHKDDLAKGRQG